MWITNYIERTPYVSSKDVITNYKTNPSNYYGMLIGIDEDQFDYVNQSLSSPVDKQDFLNGKSCIVQYEGSEIPKEYLNQKSLSVLMESNMKLLLKLCPMKHSTAEEILELR